MEPQLIRWLSVGEKVDSERVEIREKERMKRDILGFVLRVSIRGFRFQIFEEIK